MAPRIAGITFLLLFVAGAFFLVFFAIFSPELPPGNLVSALNEISAYYHSPGNSQQHTVVLAPEEDWASLTAYTEFETGAGLDEQDRTADIAYPIRPGETLSEIACAYGLQYDFLAWYNKISNANKIRMGTVITIPSLDNIKLAEPQFLQQKAKKTQEAAAAKAVKSIDIAYESRNNGDLNGSGVTVQFSIKNPPADL
ncbi:MAG: LysM peptidoglycan-binding domain-containing protein, partial [Treponema sp.]|nr:LysM peptidoglycan-binding domain-containing protein [Treponema sp.]